MITPMHNELVYRMKLKDALEYREMSQQDFFYFYGKSIQAAGNKWTVENPQFYISRNAFELAIVSKILNFDPTYFTRPEMTCREADLSSPFKK